MYKYLWELLNYLFEMEFIFVRLCNGAYMYVHMKEERGEYLGYGHSNTDRYKFYIAKGADKPLVTYGYSIDPKVKEIEYLTPGIKKL